VGRLLPFRCAATSYSDATSASPQGSRVLLVQRLWPDAGPAGDLGPGVAGLAEPSDLVGLAEGGHVAEGEDAGEGQVGVVFEAEGPVGVAGCHRLDLVIFGCHQPWLIARGPAPPGPEGL
jgi:hypothetical protein